MSKKSGAPGVFLRFTPQDNVSLTAAGGQTPSHTSPGYDVAGAKTIVLTVKNGNSTNLDVIVQTSWDGSNWDSEPYASVNLGANKTKTIPISPGPFFMRVYVENKDTVNSTTVTTKLFVRAD